MRVSSSPPSPALQSLHPTTDLPFHLLFFQLEYSSECLYCSLFTFLTSYFLLFIFPILSSTDLFSSTFFCLHNVFSSVFTILMENFKVSQHPPKVCSKFPFHPWNVHQQFPLSTPCLMHIGYSLYTWSSSCISLDVLGKGLSRSRSSVLSRSSHLLDFKAHWRKTASVTGVKTMPLHADKLGLRKFGKDATLLLRFLRQPIDLHEEPICSYISSTVVNYINSPIISA